MGHTIKNTNRRPSLQQRIQAALAKKPTPSSINKKGLTAEQVTKLFGNSNVPAKTRRKINQKGGRLKKFKRQSVTRNSSISTAPPTIKSFTVPDWFESTGKVDVSIIIPLFRSKSVIKEQIEQWDLKEDGLKKEIIYVDDACPEESRMQVFSSWLELKNQDRINHPVGKIVYHNQNCGFAAACNTGASFANGEYLIFLNADTTVSPNWVKPMISILESDPEGIVGNLQLKQNGQIDSAGSEWSWETRAFEHIGRSIYHGRKIKPIMYKEVPADLLHVAEREMVTACCVAMSARLFHDLEGFDTSYRIGYWEDADFCMRARTNEHKIYYQPASRIIHKVGHSKQGGNRPHVNLNRGIFENRWVKTGRIDNFVSAQRSQRPKGNLKSHTGGPVKGCVIACNEEEFLEASVKSASSLVDEWFFVIGGNEYGKRAGMCTSSGYPIDNTLEIAKELVEKYGGKVIEPPGRPWQDKVEMRNAYAKELKPNDWMFLLDGDEVYKPDKLWRIVELMEDYEILIVQFWLFWNNMDTIGVGRWEQFPQERIVRWRDGMGYRGNNHLHVSMPNGTGATQVCKTWKGKEKMFYHYSWVRPLEKIRQKQAYYKHQTSVKGGNYLEDIFLKWRDDPESVEGRTHPMGGGHTAPFPGIHPKEIQELIEAGKLDF